MWKAMVGSAGGLASVWLLDVAFPDWMGVASLLGEKRDGSVKAPREVPTRRNTAKV